MSDHRSSTSAGGVEGRPLGMRRGTGGPSRGARPLPRRRGTHTHTHTPGEGAADLRHICTRGRVRPPGAPAGPGQGARGRPIPRGQQGTPGGPEAASDRRIRPRRERRGVGPSAARVPVRGPAVGGGQAHPTQAFAQGGVNFFFFPHLSIYVATDQGPKSRPPNPPFGTFWECRRRGRGLAARTGRGLPGGPKTSIPRVGSRAPDPSQYSLFFCFFEGIIWQGFGRQKT